MNERIDTAINDLLNRMERESRVFCKCGHNQYQHDIDEDVCNECSRNWASLGQAVHLFTSKEGSN